jgi:transposase-like protein
VPSKNEQATMLNTKGMRFPVDVILVCIRWYAAYPLSYRHLEEIMQERGVVVDHSSINRWAIRFLPLLEKVFRKHKHAVGSSWRMDETYIKVNGTWKYLYRAVDKQGQTVAFCRLLSVMQPPPGASSRRLYGTMACPAR